MEDVTLQHRRRGASGDDREEEEEEEEEEAREEGDCGEHTSYKYRTSPAAELTKR